MSPAPASEMPAGGGAVHLCLVAGGTVKKGHFSGEIYLFG